MTAPILPLAQAESLRRAVALLRQGALVVVPTDTVYGIAALPLAHDALLEYLYGSPSYKSWPATPLLLEPQQRLNTLVRTNRAALRLTEQFWPGALTLLLPAAPDFPFGIKNPQIAVRVPNFPALWPLLHAAGGYLIVGRAARSGYPSAITAQEAADQLGEDVALILDGGVATFGLTSTVVDCIEQPPCVVQRGALGKDEIHAGLNLFEERNRAA